MRLTPGGQAGETAGHWQGHLQYCVRVYGSVVVEETAVAGGMMVEFWEKA